ncbi:trimethyllysine dioxygenase, mitochondrial-like [Anneissia japonica]|uniref:trimethyllysine dioxygenase, mitochondrial-like n=1 Tax=Anneissia japonica TaxID=1529436 RepID=UPI0014256375|nr:trimethyllysine dioxygenase, mitochondrial-like [Anneissia japonica]XP_033122592.1 trimethyllysine dioxygenase, mitochondrial-like [Anneissia japonica]
MNIICRTRPRLRVISTVIFGKQHIFHKHSLVEAPVYYSTSSISTLSSGRSLFNKNLHQISHQQRWDSFKRHLATISEQQMFSQHEDYLELISVEGDDALKIPYVWLRDHCRCSECYSHDTNQRNFDAFKTDIQDESPTDIQIDNQSINITCKLTSNLFTF